MTVAQLIKWLKTMPQDANVKIMQVTYDEGGQYSSEEDFSFEQGKETFELYQDVLLLGENS